MPDNRTASRPDCHPLLSEPGDLSMVYQPIVDLASASIAGYAALARFPGTASPDVWFAAADDAGLRAELEALAVLTALAALPDLPPRTFLSLTVSSRLLGSAPVSTALAGAPTLTRVVLQLTGPCPARDLAALREQTAAVRARGAVIAVDDAGSGWSGLHQLAQLRPQLVTAGRSLVAGVDRDPVAGALAEMLGGFCNRIGAGLLATGVETAGELAVLTRLGVPLAQGWLFGRPRSGPAPLEPAVAELVRGLMVRAVRPGDTVASLLRPLRQRDQDEDGWAPAPYVVLDRTDVPVELLLTDPRTGQPYRAPVSLQVPPSTGVVEVLQRALARPPAQRFDPVLCTAGNGTVLGLLRIEDLASAAGR